MASVNCAAKALKAMHVSKSPIIFTNVWDVLSFNTVLSLNEGDNKAVKEIATASSAIVGAAGCLPLSADLQDGYGSRIEEVVTTAVQAGVSGANIEDSISSTDYGKMYPLDEQVRRLKSALKAATEAGCPDFVLNARCDIFALDDPDLDDDARLKEAIIRGKAFLELGATTVFYLGGPRRGLTKAHLQTLVKELNGRVAANLGGYAGDPTVLELAELGVARVSIGDDLYLIAMNAIRKAALAVFVEGRLPA
ncbi:hypothetical protein Aspvir_003202 [Aspergillus viridinutans]|uniref:Carboxyphosphonoenolpyruvate phosphonomutase-like protein n=1 Tax=Aspergillus viridinutans TaxID=75553 RepID=A0A9P3C9M3_ASPVI|nr:uncharacterized protein Aspvir_003202 [Aspergillus viridinutans]GIK07536.1 hypothetical protein Aspvir_003202 [Aspergillus viridinutans]